MPIQHFSLEKTTNYTPTPSIQLTNGNECKVLIAITVPTRNWKYIFKVRTDILISELRKQAIETYNLKEIDFLNHGLYLPPDSGKKGKFLQDERTISEYPQLVAIKLNLLNDDQLMNDTELINDNKSKEPVVLELLPKIRFVEEYRLEGSKSITKRINSKHHQKRLLSAIKRDDIGRVTDLLEQGLDPNFQYPSSGVIPLGCAAELADPREMILQLVNAGAHLDYRDSDTMTALHRAAINGNFKAIEVFLELGQNPNVRDKNDLTPLYYACSEDIRPECIQRLLYDHAILGVTDDKGRQEIHQACLNGRSKTLKQLIIYGADLNAQVENHNTPLHLCVLADEMECLLLLLRYGALPTIINSSGQTPYELAILIERMNLAKILQNFDENLIEGIDQKPVYNKDRRPTIHGPRAVYDSVHFPQYNNNNNNNGNNNNNSNPTSTRKPSKAMSVDRELPPTPYQRCLSFDMNDLRQITPKRINQYVFHNKVDFRTPDIARRNSVDKKEGTMNNNNNNSSSSSNNNNRPSLPIRRQMTYSNNNDNYGGTIYNHNNLQGIPKFSRRLNFIRQRYQNYCLRSIILERGTTGYGFIMQGSDNFKERSFIANNLPSQSILSVQPNSKAEKAGLAPGDYILEINGIDVYDATHKEVVDLITTTKDMLQLKIINFQQLPEIQPRVINGNHNNNNTNANLNHSNNNTKMMNRTSFVRADLRRRNTQRSTSVDMARINRPLSIDNNIMANNHKITINTTNTTTNNDYNSGSSTNNDQVTNTNYKSILPDQKFSSEQHFRRLVSDTGNNTNSNTNNNTTNNNSYRRSIQSLNPGKSQSAVLIIENETDQLKNSLGTTITTQPLSSPSTSSSSPHIINTYAYTTNINNGSSELKQPEIDQSTITIHNGLTNKQDQHQFIMKSLSSSTSTTPLSPSSSSFSSQPHLYSSSSSPLKYKQDNKIIHSLKPFEPFTQNTGYSISHSQHHPHHHDDLSDSKWDSESDLLNISEITEISVNSMNDGNFKKIMNLNHKCNIGQVELHEKPTNMMNPSSVVITPSLLLSSSSSSISSPVKNRLTIKVNSNMNGKMRSIHSEPLLYQMKTETDHDNNDNNNHSCNDEEISTVPKTSINNNLILNGHEIDDDESDSCLI
uniref:Putative sh3 and multiple ankyrin repeat domains protein 1,2 (Shank1,2) n=1 Tax=Schistosoma mansoni TaxID=6183 RepID=A0A3Q0KNY7_SCHMA